MILTRGRSNCAHIQTTFTTNGRPPVLKMLLRPATCAVRRAARAASSTVRSVQSVTYVVASNAASQPRTPRLGSIALCRELSTSAKKTTKAEPSEYQTSGPLQEVHQRPNCNKLSMNFGNGFQMGIALCWLVLQDDSIRTAFDGEFDPRVGELLELIEQSREEVRRVE